MLLLVVTIGAGAPMLNPLGRIEKVKNKVLMSDGFDGSITL